MAKKTKTEVELDPFTGQPLTLFDKVGAILRRADALLTCAKYSLQYKDDPGTYIDGEEPDQGVDNEIHLLHDCGKLLDQVYDLVDAHEAKHNRQRRRAKPKKKKNRK